MGEAAVMEMGIGHMPEYTIAQFLERTHFLNVSYQMGKFFSAPLQIQDRGVRICTENMLQDLSYTEKLHRAGWNSDKFYEIWHDEQQRTNYLDNVVMGYIEAKANHASIRDYDLTGWRLLFNTLTDIQRPLKKIIRKKPVFPEELKELSDFVDFACGKY